MGASDDSIREELIGAVLGELSLLRRDVKALSQLLDTTGKQFKDDGELTLLHFTSRYEQFLNQFAASSTDVLAEAGRFSEARDQLLGEISLRQYDEAIRNINRYCGSMRNMDQINIRSAECEDYSRILALQNDNYIDNLRDTERKDGFLSAKLSGTQIDAIAKDLGIAVAYEVEDTETLLGFFCVSRLGHWQAESIVHRLVHALQTDFRDSRVADSKNYCIFGPMCLSRSARGKNVLRMLYEHAIANLHGRFAAATGFISVDNPRSLSAMAKLDWQPVGRFHWGERQFHALIRDIV